jgi:hypothetical protein
MIDIMRGKVIQEFEKSDKRFGSFVGRLFPFVPCVG